MIRFLALLLVYCASSNGFILHNKLKSINLNFIVPKQLDKFSLDAGMPIPAPQLNRILTNTVTKINIPLLKQLSTANFSRKAIILALFAIITKFKSKISKSVNKATNAMEAGWLQRGQGSALTRTIEVWKFAFQFGFKWVIHRHFFFVLMLCFYPFHLQ